LSPSALLRIRPYPKAPPRTTTARGRKKGSSRILTDTPEKRLIEEQEEAHAQKSKKRLELNAGSSSLPIRKQSKNKSNKGKQKMPKSSNKNLKEQRPAAASDGEGSEDESFCIYCCEPYSNSRSREKWIQCTVCHMWAHLQCTDQTKNLYFICQNCESDDDM